MRVIRANSTMGLRALALAVLVLAGSAGPASSASAATPAWKVMGVTGPTNLPPISDEIQQVSVDATGGDFTLGLRNTVATGTGNFVGSSTNITGVATTSGAFAVGQQIFGSVILPGTTIANVSGTTITLSQPATTTFAFGVSLSASDESDTTGPIPFDADEPEVAAALNGLTTVGGAGGSVEVEGGPGDAGATNPYFVRFGGSLAGENVAQMTSDPAGLSGGSESASVSTQTEGGTPGTGVITITLANIGGAPSSGLITLKIGPLPDGIETSASASGGGFFCTPTGAGRTELTCVGATPVSVESTVLIKVPVRVKSAVNPGSAVPIAVEGGGATTGDEHALPITVSALPVPAGIQVLWAGAFDEDGAPSTQAGGHPARAAAFFRLNTIVSPSGQVVPAGDPRDVEVEIPPGFVGNPLITPRCPQEELTGGVSGNALCPLTAAIGRLHPYVALHPDVAGADNEPLYNNEPYFGYAAQFTARLATAQATLVGELRSDDDYGVTVTSPNIPLVYKVFGAFSALNGSPAGGNGAAFLTNPTGCSEGAQGAPVTRIAANTWQAPSLFDRHTVDLPKIQGCDELEFEPEFSLQPSTDDVASPTAATARLHIDQSGLLEAEELATAHLKRSVVELPKGLVLNPAGANGLDGCSTDEIGLLTTNGGDPNPIRFDKSSPDCPDTSKIGTVEVSTPLLEESLDGVVYLADQEDNPFGSLVAIYLVIDDARTGISVKLPGEVKIDNSSGKITTVFDHNPQLPVEDLTLKVRGGKRSSLATPDVCRDYTTKARWTPWSAPESGPPAKTSDDFDIDDGSPCPDSKGERPFDLGLAAGSAVPVAGAYSPFTLRLTRPDGNQELSSLTATVPPGLTAKLKGVAICPEALLAAAARRDGEDELSSPSCPAASQIGRTTIGAGIGPKPLYVKTGKAYLAGPYKGAPLSLAFVVPAVAGPFDLGVQVVRTALHVNPHTAQITATSDPIPEILEGVPLAVRDIRVHMDRPGFTLNPTSCEPLTLSALVGGGSGAVANLANRFQVGSCEALGFEPRMNLRLFGGVKRGKYQGLRAVVRPRPGDANISRTVVRMPRSAFLAQEHIRTVCTRVQFAADACPEGSIYGKATAWSPLLDYPLEGNVYLRSSDNKLPDLVADLRGPAHQPIRVEVVGRTDSVKGALRNTFDVVPDAPVSYFRLQLFGGEKGLIVNSRNICRGSNRAVVGLNAHNGRRALLRPVLRNKRCATLRKKQRKAAKRSAHRSKRPGA